MATSEPDDDNSEYGERVLERMERLLRRACASELPATEAAPQILAVIQEYVAHKTHHPDEYKSFANDTPGAESMGWELWGMVDQLAREDDRHHDALVAVIRALLPLVRAQPWQLWGRAAAASDFFLGPAFVESVEQFAGLNGGRGKPEGIKGWVNCCRFVARMTRDTEHDFTWFLLCIAREAGENRRSLSTPARSREAAVLALEAVVEVCGARLFRSEEDTTKLGRGNGVRKGWVFWEAGLLEIAGDAARLVPVRDSARRSAVTMKAIRAGDFDENAVVECPSRAAMAAVEIESMVVVASNDQDSEYIDSTIVDIQYLYS